MANHGGHRASGKLELVLSEKKPSPLGNLLVASSRQGAFAFAFGVSRSVFLALVEKRARRFSALWSDAPHPALEQVEDYLKGKRHHFTLEIDYTGLTDFKVRVYHAVSAVPYGETATYGQIANQISRPRAARAVGVANGANPLPILIPCHRLVGADGSLRGYGGTGGLETKRWLQNLEANNK